VTLYYELLLLLLQKGRADAAIEEEYKINAVLAPMKRWMSDVSSFNALIMFAFAVLFLHGLGGSVGVGGILSSPASLLSPLLLSLLGGTSSG